MKLLNPLGLIFSLLIFVSSAHAMPLIPIITGADMEGMNVTAFFNGTSETAVWATTSTDASVPSGEGFAGAAAGTGWGLRQQGFTLGNFVAGQGALGVWTATNNTGFEITSVVIDASAGNIVFDQFFDTEFTAGSDIGRTFLSGTDFIASNGVYSNPVSDPDLFGTLTINFTNGFANANSFQFLADTDKLAEVPDPSSGLLLGLGLVGLFVRRLPKLTSLVGTSWKI